MSDLITDEMVTDEMVEVATVASINVALAPYREEITTTSDLQGGVAALAEMRAALEAAAPLIAARALEALQKALQKALQEALDMADRNASAARAVGRTGEQIRWLDMYRAIETALKEMK